MQDSHFSSFRLRQDRQVDESITNFVIHSIIVFDVLHILGLLLISATLCTAWFSSGIRRSIGWYSFNIPWALTCIGHILLIRHQTGPFPDSVLCLCSAMLIYAFTPLHALTLVVFVLEIFFSISHPSSIPRTTMLVLYFMPYGIFAGVLIMVFILGRLNPSTVFRAPFGMFCIISNGAPKYLSWAIVICSLTAALILGVRIILKCRRQWNISGRFSTHDGTQFCLVLRVGLIAVLSILSIPLAIMNMFKWNNTITVSVYTFFAAFPVMMGIIFGSQEDILRVWMFWRKHPQALPYHTSREAELTNVNNKQTEPEDDNKVRSISPHPIRHEFVVVVPTQALPRDNVRQT